MTRTLQYLSMATIAGFVMMAPPAFAQAIQSPSVPAEIKAPSGHSIFAKGAAIGTQNYICLPAGSNFAWKLFGPQATLYLTYKLFTVEGKQQIMTHYLSANPDENGSPRPTWQSSLDSSSIWGKAAASSSDPNFVASGAIPWLLVEVVGSERGTSSANLLAPAKYIQRVNTTGGGAPSTGCAQASEVGATALVPYTADYYFFKLGN